MAQIPELGKKIKQLRSRAGYTQVELARRAGLSQGYISRLETDDLKDPPMSTLVKLSRAFGITLDELVYGPST